MTLSGNAQRPQGAMLSRFRRVAMLITTALVVMVGRPSLAQEPATGWSPPEVIFETTGELALSSMALVADGFGRAHLFFPHQVDESSPGSIDYMSWDGSVWSEAVDILVDPNGGNPNGVRAVIDPQQVVHLLFGGQGNRLMHTSAPLAKAGSPWAWSEPQMVANALPAADIVAAPDGTLYAAYAVYPLTGFVELVASTDGGQSWSAPVAVAYVSEPGTAPNEVRLAIDDRGRLHAAWTEYDLPDGWPPTGTFYSRSTDGGQTWEPSLRMAEADHGQIGVGTLGDDGVHLVWRSTIGGDGTFHQYSSDGGVLWSIPSQYDDRGGFSGLPSFAVDAVGRLHYLTGRGTYGTWESGQAGTYEDLRTEEVKAQAERSGGERGVLAITTGNRLHVVFETDFDKLWYMSKPLDVPGVATVTPVAVLPQPDGTDTRLVENTTATEGASEPTASAADPLGSLQDRASSEPPGLIVGVLAAAALVGIAVAANVLRTRGR